jgi:DNA polymerase-3 subunit alpha
MQNFAGLMEKKLLPQELNFEQQLFRYNKLLKKNCKSEKKGYLVLENRDMPYYDYYEKYFNLDYVRPDDNNNLIIEEKQWKKQYDDKMKPAKDYITNNQKELLEKMNNSLFQEMWNKYAAGNYSSWEMDSMSYYYHPHELINVNKGMYDIVEYNSLPSSPIVEKTFSKGGRNIPIYATQKICGTVIAKDDSKSIVVILTPESGVVNVKFTREYYARLNKQISQRQPDGTKKVIESPWTKKGTLVVVNGFKRDNMFVGKAYKRDNAYQFYKITKVYNNGTIDMINSRADEV